MHKQKLTQLELRKLYGHKKNDKKWWKWYRGSLRGQRHLPSKNYPKYLPPPPRPRGSRRWIWSGRLHALRISVPFVQCLKPLLAFRKKCDQSNALWWTFICISIVFCCRCCCCRVERFSWSSLGFVSFVACVLACRTRRARGERGARNASDGGRCVSRSTSDSCSPEKRKK